MFCNEKPTVVEIASVYFWQDATTLLPPRKLEKLVTVCRTQNWEFILSDDLNAHNVVWRSNSNKSLHNYITSNNISIKNYVLNPNFIIHVRLS